MYPSQAYEYISGLIDPQGIADKINELQPRPGDFGDFTYDNGQLLIEWIATQLVDEDEPSDEAKDRMEEL